VELEGAFKLLRPGVDGNISIGHINRIIQNLEEASLSHEAQATEYK
jgi:Ca2+-binding EF-hand superfamily protein